MTDEELKKIVKEGMETLDAELERVMEIINNDPALKDVKCPEEVHDKLFAQIAEYEEQKRLANLTDEEKEWIRYGKIYKKRHKWSRVAVLIAAAVAVLALGTVSFGEDKNILTMLKQMLSGGEQTVTDSGSTEPIQYVEEQAVFEKIEDTYDFEPVKIEYRPQQIVFQEAVFYTDMQGVNLYYGTENEAKIIYTIRPNYRESSFATIIEDEKVQEYQIDVNGVEITVTEYKIVDSGKNRWTVDFVYQDVQYWIRITDMRQNEVEKIVNTLSFFN